MNLTVEQYNSLKCIVENMIRLNVGTGKDLTLNDIKNGDYIRHYPNFCHGKTNGHGNAINLYSGVIA